ncbi:hypothetical protein F0562_032656 [Nyssa sinensis]|uniref:F-box domain-containing protein n=1 Tax=Nyssa sinensis TaxID=561372 RepID=A0A5J5AQN5_9ASTE|nr:hypothetical protein F0562_032656 [Nyssa sinensis]
MDVEMKEHEVIHNSLQNGPPHEALFLVIAYLPLFELLSMNQVCKSLRDAVNNDILPWLNLVVNTPLNSRISDDILMKITSKANGRLRTLALINCTRITDDGLQSVIEKNPHINKLYIPSCTGLTPEGVIRAAKTLAEHNHSLTSLKISGIYNINKEHLKTLCSYLDVKSRNREQQKQQRRLYLALKYFSTYAHEKNCPPIDVDVCPKCDEVRMVFECPGERQCQLSECRGCYLCIPRCEDCGKCLEFEELGEAACADILCSDCWVKLPKCSFCNQPYCNQHAHREHSLVGSSGFVCDVCHAKFVNNSYD